MPLSRKLALMNRRFTNKAAAVVARRAIGYAVVIHRGRKSGTEYRTPVSIFRDGTGYRIPLTYGPGIDWAKNVTAAGEFAIEHRGRNIDLVAPTIVQDDRASWAPIVVRQALRRIGANYSVQTSPA
jgi:deazaflavin-dependent oxidoreductase (nitroreductase family)